MPLDENPLPRRSWDVVLPRAMAFAFPAWSEQLWSSLGRAYLPWTCLPVVRFVAELVWQKVAFNRFWVNYSGTRLKSNSQKSSRIEPDEWSLFACLMVCSWMWVILSRCHRTPKAVYGKLIWAPQGEREWCMMIDDAMVLAFVKTIV